MASKSILLLLGIVLLVTAEASSYDEQLTVKIFCRYCYQLLNEVVIAIESLAVAALIQQSVAAIAMQSIHVDYAGVPSVKPVSPAPPVYVKPPNLAPPVPAPPVVKPPTPAPPVVKPPPTPAPPVKVPPAPVPPPPLKPPVAPAPPVPIIKSPKDCSPLCDFRCKLHSRQRVCKRACVTCCVRCKCVPPGTYGNREKCGTCYTSMVTHGNRPKCP